MAWRVRGNAQFDKVVVTPFKFIVVTRKRVPSAAAVMGSGPQCESNAPTPAGRIGVLRVANAGADRAILGEWLCFANAEITQACELIENQRGEGCAN